jgi:hypothetical protein
VSARGRALLPLVLATVATQSSIVVLAVSTNTARLTERIPRKALIVVSALPD